MQDLRQLTEVEGLGGLLQTQPDRFRLPALGCRKEPARIREPLMDHRLELLLGDGGAGQEVVEGLPRTGTGQLPHQGRPLNAG